MLAEHYCFKNFVKRNNLVCYKYKITRMSIFGPELQIFIFGKGLKSFLFFFRLHFTIYLNTSLAANGALAHRLQRRTACEIQNGPKIADGVWKCVYSWVFGHSKQLSPNKFFDPSTPSMREG